MRIAIAALAFFVFTGFGYAACTPSGMAQYRAADARLASAKAKVVAGDCSAIAEWKRALSAVHAILRDSQRQTVPYTCNVSLNYPAVPKCGGSSAARIAAAKKEEAKEKLALGPAKQPATANAVSCSDITGTGGNAPVQTNCRNADRALYAARQVRQSNPQVAAAEYKKAATAARNAGDNNLELSILREASDGASQAMTGSSTVAADPGSAPSGGPASVQDISAGDKTIPTPCQDLTGKFGCRDDKNLPPLERDAQLNQGETERLNRPREWSPDTITPDYSTAIMQLAKALLDADAPTSPDAQAREQLQTRLRYALQRRLADHRAPLKADQRACLQPVVATGRRQLDLPLSWHPYQIKKEAIDQSHLCDGAVGTEAKDACREAKYGEAVMWAEPELAGQCRGAGDPAEAAECAKRKFLNAFDKNDGVVSGPAPDSWTMPAACNPTGTPEQRLETLRDQLRARLAAAISSRGYSKDQGKPIASTAEAPIVADDVVQPSPPLVTDADEAYCSYMARAVTRGELTLDGSTPIPPECRATIAAAEALKADQQTGGPPLFTMSDVETDREIARLIGASK